MSTQLTNGFGMIYLFVPAVTLATILKLVLNRTKASCTVKDMSIVGDLLR